MLDKHELQTWLSKHNIDITQWGTGQAKSLQDLWQEYTAGESTLEENPPMRRVQVVQIILRRENRVLLEIEQELSDSRRRSRYILPSEKMKLGESVATAVVRCLHEELGLNQDEITFIATDYEISELVKKSPSYPGLRTHYIFHRVEARVKGLPNEDFWRDNMAGGSHDPVSKHLWGWREVID